MEGQDSFDCLENLLVYDLLKKIKNYLINWNKGNKAFLDFVLITRSAFSYRWIMSFCHQAYCIVILIEFGIT